MERKWWAIIVVIIVLILLIVVLYKPIFYSPPDEHVNILGCGNLNISGTYYVLNQNIYSALSNCINITADNIVFDGNGFYINLNNISGGSGILISGVANVTIIDVNVSGYNEGVKIDSGSTDVSVLDSLFELSLSNGILIDGSSNYTEISNNVVTNGFGNGIMVRGDSSYTLVKDTEILDSSRVGLRVRNSSNGVFDNLKIINSGSDAIKVGGGVSSHINLFKWISITGTNISAYDINFENHGVLNMIADMENIGKYRFFGVGTGVTFSKTGVGKIEFLENLLGNGTNLSRDIRIQNNLVSVESNINSGLNKTGKISLESSPGNGLTNPVILRNGVKCPYFVCHNLTSFYEETVVFNVTGWTNYSIGEEPSHIRINFPEDAIYDGDDFPLTFDVELLENEGSVWYTLNRGLTNVTMNTTNNRSFEWNIAELNSGNYSFEAYGNISSSREIVSDNINFSIKITNLKIVVPRNTTYDENDFPIQFKIKIHEKGLAWYTLNSGARNVSMNTKDNITFIKNLSSMNDGSYIFRAYANYTSGERFTKSITFSVDISDGNGIAGTTTTGNEDGISDSTGTGTGTSGTTTTTTGGIGETSGIDKSRLEIKNVTYWLIVAVISLMIIIIIVLLVKSVKSRMEENASQGDKGSFVQYSGKTWNYGEGSQGYTSDYQ